MFVPSKADDAERQARSRFIQLKSAGWWDCVPPSKHDSHVIFPVLILAFGPYFRVFWQLTDTGSIYATGSPKRKGPYRSDWHTRKAFLNDGICKHSWQDYCCIFDEDPTMYLKQLFALLKEYSEKAAINPKKASGLRLDANVGREKRKGAASLSVSKVKTCYARLVAELDDPKNDSFDSFAEKERFKALDLAAQLSCRSFPEKNRRVRSLASFLKTTPAQMKMDGFLYPVKSSHPSQASPFGDVAFVLQYVPRPVGEGDPASGSNGMKAEPLSR